MALDWTMLDPGRQPVPLDNETTILSIDRDSQVEFSLNIPDAPPSGSNAAAGGKGGAKKMKEIGRLWLTTQRLIFTTPEDGKTKPSFESLSIPLVAILSTKFEQPFFGANYLVLEIKPSPGGGLTSGTSIEIRFYDRGLFEFVSLLEKTRERVVYMKRQAAMDDDENLPAYASSGSAVGTVTSYADTPPDYDP